jgi:hypothetical protein
VITRGVLNINQHAPYYTYALRTRLKVGTATGSEHTTRQNRTEVKPDGARETRWGEGAGVLALCGCGRPLAGERGVWAGGAWFCASGARRNWALADDCSQARYPLLGGFRSELRRATTAGAAALPL